MQLLAIGSNEVSLAVVDENLAGARVDESIGRSVKHKVLNKDEGRGAVRTSKISFGGIFVEWNCELGELFLNREQLSQFKGVVPIDFSCNTAHKIAGHHGFQGLVVPTQKELTIGRGRQQEQVAALFENAHGICR